MKRWNHCSSFSHFVLLELETQSRVQVILKGPFLRIGSQVWTSWVRQRTLRCWKRIINGQLYVCWLINMNVLSTIDVDCLATWRANNEITRIKPHRLGLAVRVIAFNAFLNKDSGTFEAINKFFFIFLLNLWERFNPLPPLLFQKDVFGVCHLHKLLSGVEATRERILVDNESQLRFLQRQSTLLLNILVIYNSSWCLAVS